MTSDEIARALSGITVLERGWLSSNNILMHAAPGEAGAVLVDSSHWLHAEQTVALLKNALKGQPLFELLNTHLHSDHSGGNAAVQAAFNCHIRIPPGQFEAVRTWSDQALHFAATGQYCPPFKADAQLLPGQSLHAAGRRWDVLSTPGHDPHAVVLFDAEHGVLISADALWENGFGVVFPELEGEQGFDDVAAVLDLIQGLQAQLVVPGHGPVFTDVPAALARARRRLDSFVANPARHAWHGCKVLLKYHLMEVQQQALPSLLDWVQTAPVISHCWHRSGQAHGSLRAYGQRAVQDLVASGALAQDKGVVFNR